MKNLFLFASLLFLFSCSEVQENETTDAIFESSGCSKCGCKSWRGDSGDPERCVNIKSPTKALCQHKKSAHN